MPFQLHDKFLNFPNSKVEKFYFSFIFILLPGFVLLNQRNFKLENSSGMNHCREIHNMLPENFIKETSLALYSTYGLLVLSFYHHVFQTKNIFEKIALRLSLCMSLSIYSQKKSATITSWFLCGLGKHKKNVMAAKKIVHPNILLINFFSCFKI